MERELYRGAGSLGPAGTLPLVAVYIEQVVKFLESSLLL